MAVKLCILFLGGILSASALAGQCPGNDSLFSKITHIDKLATLSNQEKLKELKELEKKAQTCVLADTVRAFLFQKIGWFYYREGRYIEAIPYAEGSIKITSILAKKSASQAELLFYKYYNLSWIYSSLDNVRLKIAALDSCVAIAGRLNMINEHYLFVLYSLAQYYFDMGDYNRSIRYAERCQKVGEEYAKAPIDVAQRGGWYALSSSAWIVNSYLQMKDYEAAEKIVTSQMKKNMGSGQANQLGTLYGQLAEVLMNKGDYTGASVQYLRAFQQEQQWGFDYNCKALLNNIGYLYSEHIKNPGKSIYYFKKAMSYDRNPGATRMDSLEMVNILSNIGNFYAEQRQFDSAFVYFQKSFSYIGAGISEDGILNASIDEFVKQQKIRYLTGLLIRKGNAYRRCYLATGKKEMIKEATRVFKITDKLLDRIRSEQSDVESKLFWLNDSQQFYELAIDACYLDKNVPDAFYFFEKSRAVLLNEQLNELRWVGETNIRQEIQLAKNIMSLEKRLDTLPVSSKEYEQTKNEIFVRKQERDRMEQLIRAGNPLYYQNFLDTNFISLQQTQQKILIRDQGLLELFSGDSAIYVLAVTSTGNNLIKINKPEFDIAAEKYIAYLSDADRINRDFDGWVQASAHLYQLIFQKVTLKLTGRMIISPSGQYFPFESLVIGRHGNDPVYFLEDHAISYTYSARFLVNEVANEPTSRSRNFMGIAPVRYPASFSLASLTGSDHSLSVISSYFDKASLMTGNAASRDNFLKQFSGYKIIQLYTHASDSSRANEPVIYFADSALYLSDLVNETRPFTRLIVLSACETGKGKLFRGEGVFSFNRGFAALGIPSSVTNLWSVDNEATYHLTELFYKYVAEGSTLDLALQKAKLDFIRQSGEGNRLPYYWAAPILVGDTASISYNQEIRWPYYLLTAVLLAAVFLLLSKRRNKKTITPIQDKAETAA